jgi:hypothetical protein
MRTLRSNNLQSLLAAQTRDGCALRNLAPDCIQIRSFQSSSFFSLCRSTTRARVEPVTILLKLLGHKTQILYIYIFFQSRKVSVPLVTLIPFGNCCAAPIILIFQWLDDIPVSVPSDSPNKAENIS